MLLQQIISQASTDAFFKNYGFSSEILDVIGTSNDGSYIFPKNVFYNGATYHVGETNEPTRNPVIYRYQNGSVDAIDVGVIDFTDDPFHHQSPTLHVYDGFIYVFMVNGHGKPTKIFKSNTTDIMDGFTLHHTINEPVGYLNLLKTANDGVCLLQRVTSSAPLYGHIISYSNGSDYTDWTITKISDPQFNSTRNRHYPGAPRQYGTNTWYYFMIALRNETSTPNFFGQAYYKTQDFNTYYSLDETYSKNIPVSGLFTGSEIEANLMYYGSNSNVSTFVGFSSSCVIDDVIYGWAWDNNINYYKFYKIENGVLTEFPCNIIGLPLSVYQCNLLFHYNGNNLVINSFDSIYVCDLNFNNQILAFIHNSSAYEHPSSMPELPINLDEVYGTYMFGGSNGPLGIYPYFTTQDKFNL